MNGPGIVRVVHAGCDTLAVHSTAFTMNTSNQGCSSCLSPSAHDHFIDEFTMYEKLGNVGKNVNYYFPYSLKHVHEEKYDIFTLSYVNFMHLMVAGGGWFRFNSSPLPFKKSK